MESIGPISTSNVNMIWPPCFDYLLSSLKNYTEMVNVFFEWPVFLLYFQSGLNLYSHLGTVCHLLCSIGFYQILTISALPLFNARSSQEKTVSHNTCSSWCKILFVMGSVALFPSEGDFNLLNLFLILIASTILILLRGKYNSFNAQENTNKIIRHLSQKHSLSLFISPPPPLAALGFHHKICLLVCMV